jgi:hypothetical protein
MLIIFQHIFNVLWDFPQNPFNWVIRAGFPAFAYFGLSETFLSSKGPENFPVSFHPEERLGNFDGPWGGFEG